MAPGSLRLLDRPARLTELLLRPVHQLPIAGRAGVDAQRCHRRRWWAVPRRPRCGKASDDHVVVLVGSSWMGRPRPACRLRALGHGSSRRFEPDRSRLSTGRHTLRAAFRATPTEPSGRPPEGGRRITRRPDHRSAERYEPNVLNSGAPIQVCGSFPCFLARTYSCHSTPLMAHRM